MACCLTVPSHYLNQCWLLTTEILWNPLERTFTATTQAIIWWAQIFPLRRHQMETFSALLAICAGNSPVPGEFPTQRPVTRSFDVYFDLRPNKRWVNNREVGDLRRNRAHYDVIVMLCAHLAGTSLHCADNKLVIFRTRLTRPVGSLDSLSFRRVCISVNETEFVFNIVECMADLWFWFVSVLLGTITIFRFMIFSKNCH